MILNSPFQISPRLLPGLQIGGAWVQLEYSRNPGTGSRSRYTWTIDLPGGESFSGSDLQSGSWGGSLQSGFESLLSFLGAFAESLSYSLRTGRETENGDLFPVGLRAWAMTNSEEFSMLQCEIEETKNLIAE